MNNEHPILEAQAKLGRCLGLEDYRVFAGLRVWFRTLGSTQQQRELPNRRQRRAAREGIALKHTNDGISWSRRW